MNNKVCSVGLVVLLSAVALTSFACAQTNWWRAYGGANADQGNSVQATSDGGYIVVGYTSSYGSGGDDVYLVKTDGGGDTLSTRTYGGDSDDVAYSIEQTSDSGYIIAGYTRSFGAGGNDIYLVRTDARGETLWTRTYGGTKDDEGHSIRQTFDGGFVLAGKKSSTAYLIRTNATGDTLWTRTYLKYHASTGMCVQQTLDSGFAMVGFEVDIAGGDGAMIIKYNAAGDTVWTRYYFGDCKKFNWVRQTPDTGYIATGQTWISGTYIDARLMKFSASGDSQWSHTYGGSGNNVGCSVQPTSDGGYVMAGYTASFGSGGYDVSLTKTDSLGNAGMEEHSTRHAGNPSCILVRPNPFTSVARIPGHVTELFALSDVTGRQAALCRGDRIGVGLRPGIYFVSPVHPGSDKAVTIIKGK